LSSNHFFLKPCQTDGLAEIFLQTAIPRHDKNKLISRQTPKKTPFSLIARFAASLGKQWKSQVEARLYPWPKSIPRKYLHFERKQSELVSENHRPNQPPMQ